MALPVRAVFVSVCASALLAACPAAHAAVSTPYDPDSLGFGATSTRTLIVDGGACTFDTDTGAIDGLGCPSARAANPIDVETGDTVDGISVVALPGDLNNPETTEFVLDKVTVDSTGSITVTGTRSLAIAARHDIEIQSGGLVDVSGAGRVGGSPGVGGDGPGGGDHPIATTCGGPGGGGSFGGFGGVGGVGGTDVPSGGMYGDDDQSTLLDSGSGGGGSAADCGTLIGGNGGGGVALVAMGKLTIDGKVAADGEPKIPDVPTDQGGPGGGSGGAILLMAPSLSLGDPSNVTAVGGSGDGTFGTGDGYEGGGGGGGGRVSLVSDQSASAVSTDAVTFGWGGQANDADFPNSPGGIGEAGTITADPFLSASGPSSRQVGQSATFTGSAFFGLVNLSWSFGDGGTGTGNSASHTYTAPGTYHVTLTATPEDSNESVTKQLSITVHALPSGPGGGGGTQPTPPPPSPPAPPPKPHPQCVVPRLKGLSLAAAKTKLRRAHCKLGKVKKPRLRGAQKHKPLVVKSSSPSAGKRRANGAKVNLTLAPKKPKRRHHH